MPLSNSQEHLVIMKDLLRSAKLKVTPLRIAVLECLFDAARPLSHGEIQNLLPDLDRVTLYRILASFEEGDIAHQVQGLDGAWRFCAHIKEGGECPGNHPHFLCSKCGIMLCLTDQSMPRVNVPEGYSVSGKQFVVYGFCPDCSGEASENGNVKPEEAR